MITLPVISSDRRERCTLVGGLLAQKLDDIDVRARTPGSPCTHQPQHSLEVASTCGAADGGDGFTVPNVRVSSLQEHVHYSHIAWRIPGDASAL